MNNNPEITLMGKIYPLATKLRVAYKIQGQHSHKPYTQIFSEIDSMPLEQQIAMLYAAFECANPEEAKFITQQKFLDEFLDNYDLAFMMDQLKAVIAGILGKDLNEEKTEAVPTTTDQGN